MNKENSFTLIELLVVIAIIGLLAAVVLVSTMGIRSKARITKALEFSQSIQRNLGANAVGIWNFDEGTGSQVKDGSGYNNDGTVNGAVYTPNTPHAAIDRGTGKWALNFSGDDCVAVPVSQSMQITNKITIEAWIYANSFSGTSNITNAGNDELQLYITSAGMLRRAGNIGGTWYDRAANTLLSLNQWHHIVFTYDGSNGVFYQNGNQDGSFSATGVLAAASGTFYIGCYNTSLRFFSGLIDEVRIYETALTLGQIQQLYAAGLERHQNLAVNKNIL